MSTVRGIAVGCLSLLTSCGGSDPTAAVTLELNPDLSGTIRAQGLSGDEAETPIEGETDGVSWRNRGRILFASGDFSHIGSVRIGEVTFVGGTTEDGMSYLKVTVPRGDDPGWPDLLTVTDDERRGRLNRLLESSRVGETLEIRVTAPAPLLSAGYQPRTPGVQSEHSGRDATLSVTLDAARKDGDELVWALTW